MLMSPMFLEPPLVVSLVMGAAVLGVVVGLLWIHRIGGSGDDPGPPIFRSRAEDPPRLRPPERRRLALPRLPAAVQRRMTIRWLATRFELATAVVCVAIVVALGVVGPPRTSAMFTGPDLSMPLAVAGTVGCLVGLAWMIHIAREPAETGRPVWRSRDD